MQWPWAGGLGTQRGLERPDGSPLLTPEGPQGAFHLPWTATWSPSPSEGVTPGRLFLMFHLSRAPSWVLCGPRGAVCSQVGGKNDSQDIRELGGGVSSPSGWRLLGSHLQQGLEVILRGRSPPARAGALGRTGLALETGREEAGEAQQQGQEHLGPSSQTPAGLCPLISGHCRAIRPPRAWVASSRVGMTAAAISRGTLQCSLCVSPNKLQRVCSSITSISWMRKQPPR